MLEFEPILDSRRVNGCAGFVETAHFGSDVFNAAYDYMLSPSSKKGRLRTVASIHMNGALLRQVTFKHRRDAVTWCDGHAAWVEFMRESGQSPKAGSCEVESAWRYRT